MDLKERLSKIMAQKNQVSDTDALKIKNELAKVHSFPLNNNTVAVIESHRKHAEVYPSVIKYFLDLGYDVHLFHLEDHKKDNSLCRCSFDVNRFHEFVFPQMPETEEFFDILTKYSYVFVMTMFTHNGYNFLNSLEKGFMQKYQRDNVYCIDHDFVSLQKNMQSIEQRFLNQDKVFVLRDGIEYNGKTLPFVSPIYFGQSKITPKNDKTNFICVGGGWQNNLRNFKLLFENINNLIENAHTDFKVTFIGATRTMLEEFITPLNESFLDIRGFAPFSELYDCMEQADFILFNIDDTCNEFEKYLKLGITGSYSLAIGFSKPAIIFEPLVSVYGMEGAVISYTKATLGNAMEQAIMLSKQNYEQLQKNMRLLNETCMSRSLNNMKKFLLGRVEENK